MKKFMELISELMKDVKVKISSGVSLSYFVLETFEKTYNTRILEQIEAPPYFADKWAHASFGYFLSAFGQIVGKNDSYKSPIVSLGIVGATSLIKEAVDAYLMGWPTDPFDIISTFIGYALHQLDRYSSSFSKKKDKMKF